MKLQITKLVPSAALLCIIFASCQKNGAPGSQISSQNSSPLTRTTTMIGAMEQESDLEMADVLNPSNSSSDCPVVTYNPSMNVYPYTETVNYGTGCMGDDGILRSGKRFVTVYADKNTAPAGKVISVTTYSNYYANGVSISGNVKMSVASPSSSGMLVLKYAVDKTVTDSMGNTSSFVNSATEKRVSGNGTETVSDDVYNIFQNAYGTQISGDSAMITWKSSTDPANPIVKMNGCHWRSQGGLKITLKQLAVTTNEYLDYGNGDCDNQATVTINNGQPQTVTLPFFFFAGEL